MIVYNGYQTFKVMGIDVDLASEDMGNARSTVAEIGGRIHYLGNEPLGIASAIFAWQEVNGRELTGDELRQVMIDNHLIDNTNASPQTNSTA